MSEQQDVIEAFGEAGVLAGVVWAYQSAVSRTLEIYSEEDGHDAALLGNLRYTYLKDRLDRVFACRRYAVSAGDDAAHLDVLYRELSRSDIDTMPHLGSSLVHRADFNRSPGWIFEGRRFLLASAEYGKVGQLPWPQKSPTKQKVAGQPSPDSSPLQESLFNDGLWEEEPQVEVDFSEIQAQTFVVGHTLDSISGLGELVFGRPRLNTDGGPAWHWSQNLLSELPGGGGRRPVEVPAARTPDAVPDAPVRLRRDTRELGRDQASGGL